MRAPTSDCAGPNSSVVPVRSLSINIVVASLPGPPASESTLVVLARNQRARNQRARAVRPPASGSTLLIRVRTLHARDVFVCLASEMNPKLDKADWKRLKEKDHKQETALL